MKIVFFLIISVFLFTNSSTYSQGLSIGDVCPDVEARSVFNYKTSNLKLSDFRGKLIILDFWGTTCRGCIEAFPKMDSLQKKFGNKIQIIAVGNEAKDSIIKFLRNRKQIRIPDIPFITGDVSLTKFFPRNFLPWHVWLDSNRTVIHITESMNTNNENIEDYLIGKKIRIKELKYIDTLDTRKPLIAEGNGRWLDKMEYYSYLCHCITGASAHNYTFRASPSDEMPYRISRNCQSALVLLKTAFSEGGKYNFEPSATISLEVKDTFKFVQPKNHKYYSEWRDENSYSYDIYLSPSKTKDIYKMMQNDLRSFFNVNVSIEKRSINCFVLIRTSSIDKLKTKGGKSETDFYKETQDSVRFMRNLPFSDLIQKKLRPRFNELVAIPFIDDTGYIGNIDIRINKKAIDWADIEVLKREFQKYDLDLVLQERLMDVLVIREKAEIF